MTEVDCLAFNIQRRLIERHEGATPVDPDNKVCTVSPFVCMECKDKCEFIKKVLANG